MTWPISIDPDVCSRLCLTLLHSLWQVALLAAAAWLLSRATRSVARQHALHAAALVASLVALGVTYWLLESPTSTPAVVTVVSVSNPASFEPALASDPPPIQTLSPATTPSSPLEAAQEVLVMPSSPRWTHHASWLAAVYLAGVVVMLLRLVGGLWHAERLATTGEPVRDARLVRVLNQISRQWSLRATPVLRQAEEVVVPKVVGLVRPTILLPAAALTGLTPGELEMILAHELAHVRRHDMWIHLAQRLAEAVLFFNPALWWLSRRVSTLREYCCDELACEAVQPHDGEPRLRYAQALLHVVELKGSARQTGQLTALAATGRSPSELRRRVARLFGEPIREPLRLSRGGVLVLLAGVLLLAAPVVWPVGAETTEGASDSTKLITPSVGVGEYRIGESTLKDILGEDTAENRKEFSKKGVIFEFNQGRELTAIAVSQPEFRTVAGIGPGSTIEAMRKAFPGAKLVKGENDKFKSEIWKADGIEFWPDGKGKVAVVRVSATKRPQHEKVTTEALPLRCRLAAVSPDSDDESPDLTKTANEFATGDDLTFAVELTNVSDEPVTLLGTRLGEGYGEAKGKLNTRFLGPHLFDFDFTDAQGDRVPRSERAFVSDMLVLHGASTHTLAPGEALNVLLRPAEFMSPMERRLPSGQFRARVRYLGPSGPALAAMQEHWPNSPEARAWSGEAVSNPVDFTIVGDSPGPDPNQLNWGPEKDGLQAAIEYRAPKGVAGDPAEAPGVPVKTKLDVLFHVKNVSDRPITFVSETGRQGDPLKVTDANGADVPVKGAWYSGWPISVRWNLKPGEVAQLKVLAPALDTIQEPGKYNVRYTIRFNSRQSRDKEGKVIFPLPGDWQDVLETGDAPLYLRADESAATAIPRFRVRPARLLNSAEEIEAAQADPRANLLSWSPYHGKTEVLSWPTGDPPLVTEQDLLSAEAKPMQGRPDSFGIEVKLTPVGGERMWRETTRLMQRAKPDQMPRMLIEVDDKVVSAPTLRSAIRNSFVIAGTADKQEEAEALARAIKPHPKANAKLKATGDLTIQLHDKAGQPIPGATVLVYDGQKFWAGQPVRFQQESGQTDAQGRLVLGGILDRIPGDQSYRVQVQPVKGAKWLARYVYVHGGKPLGSDPLIQVEKNERGSVMVTFTLREACPLEFNLVDAATDEPIHLAQVLFKDERVKDWTRLSLQDSDGQQAFTTVVPEMSGARFLATNEGYYPQEFMLDEPLSPDKKVIKKIALKPAPPIELTILLPDGKPAEGAVVTYAGPDLRSDWSPLKPADAEGRVTMKFPELGERARYRVTHANGETEGETEVEAKGWIERYKGDGAEPIRAQVRLLDDTFSVFGRVTDDAGNPLPGVEVRAATGWGTLLGGGRTTTDAEGKYRLSFGPGMMVMEDHAPLGVYVQAAQFYAEKPGWKLTAEDGYVFYLMTDQTPEQFAALLKEEGGMYWGKSSADEVVFAHQPREVNFVLVEEGALPRKTSNHRYPREWIDTVSVGTEFVNDPPVEELTATEAAKRFLPGGQVRPGWGEQIDWSGVPDHDRWKQSVDKKLADISMPPRDVTPSVRVVRFSPQAVEVKLLRPVGSYLWHHYYGVAGHYRIRRSAEVDRLFGLGQLEASHLMTYRGVGYGDSSDAVREKLGPPDYTRYTQADGYYTEYYFADDMVITFLNQSVFTIAKGVPERAKQQAASAGKTAPSSRAPHK